MEAGEVVVLAVVFFLENESEDLGRNLYNSFGRKWPKISNLSLAAEKTHDCAYVYSN